MVFVLLLPVIVSALVLGAHFFRSGNDVLMAASLAVVPLLVLKKRWIVRAVQVVLVLGAIEWIRTLTELAMERRSMGEDWVRMALILGAVALFTAGSALAFRSTVLKKRYFGD
ncbi:MAG: hypothetical protein ACLGPL_03240 [Acidobacteriota bacterium]